EGARVLELVAQPLHLRRPRPERDVVVQRDDPPGPFVKRVVADPAGAGEVAEVVVVRLRRAVGLIFVIARYRTRWARLMAAPGRVVAAHEIRGAALHVGEVAQRENRPRQAVENLAGLERAKAAFADVAGGVDDRRRRAIAATAAATAAGRSRWGAG